MKKVLIINGANMNTLEQRASLLPGKRSLESIVSEIVEYARVQNIEIDAFQSNHEGAIIDKIQQAPPDCIGIIINPGSFGHYGFGIKEAIATTSLPCIEVHIANFFKNPDNVSKIAPVCTGMVSGFGKDSYLVALDALIRITAPGKGIA